MRKFKTTHYLKSTANRYVSKNFLLWLMVTVIVLLGVIGLFEGLERLRSILGRVSLDFVLEMTLLKLPQHIIELLPFIFFIANLMSLWRLNQQHEITALRACGVSGSQLALGLFATSMGIGLLSLIFLNPIAAVCNARYTALEEKVLKQNHQQLSITATGFWVKESSAATKTIFHADSFVLKNCLFNNGTFYVFDDRDQFIERIEAREVELMEGHWHLRDVNIWRDGKVVEQYTEQERPTELTFKRIQQGTVVANQVPFWKIPERIHYLRQNDMSTRTYEVFWHRLWAEIALLGVMSVLAVGFSLSNPRFHKATRLVGMAIIAGFMIHFLNKIIHAYGEADRLSPFWSAWLPPLITGFMGIGYLMHEEEHS